MTIFEHNMGLIPQKKNQARLVTKIYERMTFEGLVHGGAVISKEIMEDVIGKPYGGPQDWNFIGPFLGLKMRLESEGYFVSQKGCEAPGFRILSSEEMAEHAMHKLMANLADNYKTSMIMATHDISKMDENAQKKHKAVQQKCAQASLMQHKIVIENNFF